MISFSLILTGGFLSAHGGKRHSTNGSLTDFLLNNKQDNYQWYSQITRCGTSQEDRLMLRIPAGQSRLSRNISHTQLPEFPQVCDPTTTEIQQACLEIQASGPSGKEDDDVKEVVQLGSSV